jgi:hypothetical protein
MVLGAEPTIADVDASREEAIAAIKAGSRPYRHAGVEGSLVLLTVRGHLFQPGDTVVFLQSGECGRVVTVNTNGPSGQAITILPVRRPGAPYGYQMPLHTDIIVPVEAGAAGRKRAD